MRSNTYKGKQQLTHCLPLDCASVVGIILILGSILPATGLKSEAIQACKRLLQNLGEHVTELNKLTAVVASSGGLLTLEANSEGRFPWKDVKSLLKAVNVNAQASFGVSLVCAGFVFD